MLLNCGVGEDTWESLGLQGDPTSPETPILWPPDVKNWFTGKRPWCCKRLKAGGEGDDRGWGGWMASLAQWTWICVNSRS